MAASRVMVIRYGSYETPSGVKDYVEVVAKSGRKVVKTFKKDRKIATETRPQDLIEEAVGWANKEGFHVDYVSSINTKTK